ncbi:hypothetical protein [Bacillus altitudinis]|uniref:hypothetical protein n=1 Tax=Bacillus altitudinis TaxID=293387 RepID=UPI00228210AD|nr:hypothetical protein [Bacillus altitudinis]MCY7454270.1 hypothetical protein [Bacillus altitudinis]
MNVMGLNPETKEVQCGKYKIKKFVYYLSHRAGIRIEVVHSQITGVTDIRVLRGDDISIVKECVVIDALVRPRRVYLQKKLERLIKKLQNGDNVFKAS